MSKKLKSPAITAGTYTYHFIKNGISQKQTRNFKSFEEFCAYAYATFDIDELPYLVELPGGVPVRFEPTIVHYYFAKGRITEDECIIMLMELLFEDERVEAC